MSDHTVQDPYQLHPDAIEDPPNTFVAIFRRIGPGLILASTIVGSGELIATTVLGAENGYTLLWLILVSCAIKVVVQNEFGRFPVSFVNVAEQAGLHMKFASGNEKAKKYIVEANGSGVALFDYDNDGWLDAFLVNGSRLEGFPKGEPPVSTASSSSKTPPTLTELSGKDSEPAASALRDVQLPEQQSDDGGRGRNHHHERR